MTDGAEDRSGARDGGGAARGILLAVLLSAPAWFGLGYGLWSMAAP